MQCEKEMRFNHIRCIASEHTISLFRSAEFYCGLYDNHNVACYITYCKNNKSYQLQLSKNNMPHVNYVLYLSSNNDLINKITKTIVYLNSKQGKKVYSIP